jgi:hypothetical protein
VKIAEQRGPRLLLCVGLALAAGAAAETGARAQDMGLPAVRRFASSELGEDTILEALSSARLDNLRPVGTTSTTFQMQLAGSIDAAFKPETRIHPRGWAHEIAAYRLAGALGMDQVPPARARAIERGQMRRHIAPDWEGDVEALFAPLSYVSGVSGPTVRGAAIYWVPNLERATLDQPEELARWTGWLTPGTALSPEERILARDLATMCLFDAVIGNGDRMSGGNLRTATRGSQRVIIRDHNLAFPVRWSEGQRGRILGELERAERFPRSFVEALRALDAAALTRLSRDETVGDLLDEAQREAVLDRRAMVLSYVAASIEEHGEAAVLDL